MHRELDFIVNHVFLPPKLPQKDDSDATKSTSLIEELLTALRLFQAHVPKQERSEWIPCIKMVSSMLELRNPFGGLVTEKAESALRTMMDGGKIESTFRGWNRC